MALNENSQAALRAWVHDQQNYVLALTRDWQGTGEDHADKAARSLLHAIDTLLGADVTDLWRDADGVSINGSLGGMIHFGVIGRRREPVLPEGLEEWHEGYRPTRPIEWRAWWSPWRCRDE